LYELAIENNHAFSMNNLANFYQNGSPKDGIEKDFQKSIQLYKKAIEFDDIVRKIK
jgi:TPR repeat protein